MTAKWNPTLIKTGIWKQTKAARFGHDMSPDGEGFNSCQVFKPLPTIWINEPFGLHTYAVHDLRLIAKREGDILSSKQWKMRTRMAQSSDPLNYWIDHHRRDVVPQDGLALRCKPTMICYTLSSRASFQSAGVFRDDTDKNLTEAYLRTTVGHFVHELDEQTKIPFSIAGAICYGARIIRTSSLAGYAFFRDPNQYIFDLAWVNCGEQSSMDAEPSRPEGAVSQEQAVKRLSIILRAAHEVSHLIVDTTMLVEAAGMSNEEAALIIRDAIVAVDFRCDQLTILRPPNIEKMACARSLLWGDEDDEEDFPAEDMEVDWGSEDEEAVNDATAIEDQETYNWREELRKLDFPEEELLRYEALPIRKVSPIRTLPEWSAETDSPHPFIAAKKAVTAMGTFDRAAYRSSAYWVGNEDVVKFFPIVLLNCLRRQESYIKKFMYKDKTAWERVKTWMERAGKKFHFPCSGHITVGQYEGHEGYNFVGSFRSTSWNHSMLGTYVIPSTLMATRHWVAFCLSILAYICTVTNNPIEGSDSAMKPLFKAGGVPIPESEQEQTNLLKEAICVLYGKKGIRFFPPRPGQEVDENEFVIPSFVSGSKGDWSSMHFIITLVDYSHVLSPEEKSVSSLLKLFKEKAQTKSLLAGEKARSHIRELLHPQAAKQEVPDSS